MNDEMGLSVGDEVRSVEEIDYEVWPAGDPDRAFLVNVPSGWFGAVVSARNGELLVEFYNRPDFEVEVFPHQVELVP